MTRFSNIAPLKIGPFEIYVISDGSFQLDAGTMFGMIPKSIWSKVVTADLSNSTRWGIRCLLVVFKGVKILIDTGLGTKLSEKQRKIYGRTKEDLLGKNLQKLGIRSSDIQMVILSHLHMDHAGGCTKEEDGRLKLRFKKAKYLIQRKEWEAAIHPNRLTRGSYWEENFMPIVEAHQEEWIDGKIELFPGFEVLFTGAHSLGHQVIKIQGDGQTLFCPGDIIPSRWHVRQTYFTSYDFSPMEVLELKTLWMRQAHEENWIIHWNHDPLIYFGTVEQQGGNFLAKPLKI